LIGQSHRQTARQTATLIVDGDGMFMGLFLELDGDGMFMGLFLKLDTRSSNQDIIPARH
jgi:hypothetical protein